MKVTNFSRLFQYLDYRFIYGCVLDFMVLPLAVLMFVIKWCMKQPFNDYLSHDFTKPPVVLIHCSGSNEMQWLFSWWLYLRGKYNTYTIQLNELMGERHQTIEQMSSQLCDLLYQIEFEYNQQVGKDCQFVLVGHSMGGLVASLAAENSKVQIYKVMTINTPHFGAPALEFIEFNTTRHTQMRPGSEFLNKLSHLQTRSEIEYICYGSAYDFQVPAPYTWAKKCKKITHNYGHTSAILFPDVWRYL